MALPETRDVDQALVIALRDRLNCRGVKKIADLDALEADDDLRLLVARVLRVLRDRRFSVGEQPEAYRRVYRRLGLDY